MMLGLLQAPSYWCLDDISVVTPSGTQLWQDGGFETSPLTNYYTICNPGGTTDGTISTTCPHSGTNSFYDGATGYSDYLSQTFITVVGTSYNISFWLQNQGGPTNSFLVIIG